jgi:RNA-directed DNA polymerase
MKNEIDKFLREKLNLELHSQKSKIISLSNGIDFIGFRIFYYHKLLRKRNINKIKLNINNINAGLIDDKKFFDIFNGWCAYANWADSYRLIKNL